MTKQSWSVRWEAWRAYRPRRSSFTEAAITTVLLALIVVAFATALTQAIHNP